MALIPAINANNLDTVKELLQEGTNPNVYEVFGRKTPLIVAAENNCHEVMHELLKHKVSVGHADRWGNTALHYAAGKGYLRCVILLLLHHSPVDVFNRRLHTPLMRAAMKGHEEVVRHLLNNHATFTSQLNEKKETALTLGCRSGNVEVVQLLLDRASPLEDRSAELYYGLREAVALSHAEVVKVLLQHGSDVNHSDDTTSPVIFLAVTSGTVAILNLLIAEGADLEKVNAQGYTPLMKATAMGRKDMVDALLAAGMLLEFQNHSLYMFMLFTGANAKARRRGRSETALTIAKKEGQNDILRLILRALKREEPL
ncbi:unnamed protein product [Hydatigera taeniaeformis]|uniref:ANK_REP_REGION domain-containing protein n=1 Tax=Hydatigena taeniaeformis TaxID=6205 RepID=A0A0R3WTJ4_HYDTA|nr:unnamed protein product [Hydatigera taeniaeformis]